MRFRVLVQNPETKQEATAIVQAKDFHQATEAAKAEATRRGWKDPRTPLTIFEPHP